MMDLYADYVKERENADIICNDQGFVVYKSVGNNNIYIIDVYVRPEDRKTGVCRSYVDSVAKETNCKWLITSCDENANAWEMSEKAILGCGFKYKKNEGTLRWYSKENR